MRRQAVFERNLTHNPIRSWEASALRVKAGDKEIVADFLVNCHKEEVRNRFPADFVVLDRHPEGFPVSNEMNLGFAVDYKFPEDVVEGWILGFENKAFRDVPHFGLPEGKKVAFQDLQGFHSEVEAFADVLVEGYIVEEKRFRPNRLPED